MNRRAINPKDTSAAAQRQRIVEALRIGPKTHDNLRALGCYQAPTRIHELRKLGYEIATERYDGYAADGFSHRKMARYELLSEPQPEECVVEGGSQ